eukprot:2364551-Karenia_brevis.AAC.1
MPERDIIPDDSTEENRKRKIRRVLEQSNAPICLYSDDPRFHCLARSFPGLAQPDAEVERWVQAQQETSIRYHNPQNRNALKPPIRAPGQSIQYNLWDYNSKFNT